MNLRDRDGYITDTIIQFADRIRYMLSKCFEQFGEPWLRQPGLFADARNGRHLHHAAALAAFELLNAVENFPADVPLRPRHRLAR